MKKRTLSDDADWSRGKVLTPISICEALWSSTEQYAIWRWTLADRLAAYPLAWVNSYHIASPAIFTRLLSLPPLQRDNPSSKKTSLNMRCWVKSDRPAHKHSAQRRRGVCRYHPEQDHTKGTPQCGLRYCWRPLIARYEINNMRSRLYAYFIFNTEPAVCSARYKDRPPEARWCVGCSNIYQRHLKCLYCSSEE